MSITSERDVYVAAHVTPPVKKALQEEASKQSSSVSLLIYKLLKAALQARGHQVEL